MPRNRSNRKPSVAERQRARQELKALLADAKIERMTQAEILEDLKARHPEGLPVPVIWGFLADRRTQAATTVRGIGGTA